tara:strand:+ start:4015 stop:4296 length:282 start_codon:yes stop_codon:yes gene_type:complete
MKTINSNKPFVPLLNWSLNSPLIDIHYPAEKIQNRISYKFWEQITKTISSKGFSNEEKVRSIHLILNERMMFNTEKQAGFDAESAEQAIKDIL